MGRELSPISNNRMPDKRNNVVQLKKKNSLHSPAIFPYCITNKRQISDKTAKRATKINAEIVKDKFDMHYKSVSN